MELGVERVGAVTTRSAVAEPPHPQRSDQAHHPAGVEALVGEAHRAVGAVDDEGSPDVAVASGVDVGLEGEADHLSAPAHGLPLHLGQAEVVVVRLGQIALQVAEGLHGAVRPDHEQEV